MSVEKGSHKVGRELGELRVFEIFHDDNGVRLSIFLSYFFSVLFCSHCPLDHIDVPSLMNPIV
jgi:hypothetical protein